MREIGQVVLVSGEVADGVNSFERFAQHTTVGHAATDELDFSGEISWALTSVNRRH